MLPEADFVVLCLPNTPETKNMIDATALNAMKRSAYLINISRGALIDEAVPVIVLAPSGPLFEKTVSNMQEVRARGVMIGIELSVDATPVVRKCLEKGLLINCTHQTVIRLLPAMNLSDADFDSGCAVLEESIAGLVG